MTEAAAAPPPHRPTLLLVPGTGRGRPSRPVPADEEPGLVEVATQLGARTLGTDFASVAAGLAQRFLRAAPLLARRGRSADWAAAIVFLLAEESRLFEYDCCATRTGIARELGSTLPTLRRRVTQVRDALGPTPIVIPDPDT